MKLITLLKWNQWYFSSQNSPKIKALNEESKEKWKNENWRDLSKIITQEFIIDLNRKATITSRQQKQHVPCMPGGCNRPRRMQDVYEVLQQSFKDNEHPFVICSRVMVQFKRGSKFGKQPFSDCNHRTAYNLCILICKIFSYQMPLDEDKSSLVEELYKQWDDMGMKDSLIWIKTHVKLLQTHMPRGKSSL